MVLSNDDPRLKTCKAIETAVEAKMPGARVSVSGSAGHFEIDVEAPAFQGMPTLERQRTVMGAIAPLMSGANAPLHAVDKLVTSAPPRSGETRPQTETVGKAGPRGADSNQNPVKLVTITAGAQVELRRLINREEKDSVGLRLGIKGGGCSGLTYSLEFSEPREGDTVVDYEGFSLFLDKKSTVYLSGVTLDYQSGLQGKGFVFRNPHATNTCGCGESFSL